MAKGFEATEKADKDKYFGDAQKILVESIPSIPIAESSGDILVKDTVKGFSLNPELLFQFKYMDLQ